MRWTGRSRSPSMTFGRESACDKPITFECAGNGRALLEPRPISQPWLTEAVGTAEWGGARLAPLLEEVGASEKAIELLFSALDRGIEGGEAQTYERSLPIAEARDAILAYDMNGAPLPPQHGFPLRLVVPGWYGMQNVKWLTRITVLEEPYSGFQNSVAYRMYDADGEPGEPVTRMLPRSLMVPPGVPDFMTRTRHVEPGPTTLTGRAWSGYGSIDRVEVSTDGGATFDAAVLDPALGPNAWRGWSFDWNATPGEYLLSSRATDSRGQHPAARPALEPEGLREQRGGEDHRAGRALDCPPRAHLQRHPADRAQAPRQLHRGDPRLPGGSGARRPGDLLHRRSARHERLLRPEGAARLRARHDGDADGRRPRSRSAASCFASPTWRSTRSCAGCSRRSRPTATSSA